MTLVLITAIKQTLNSKVSFVWVEMPTDSASAASSHSHDSSENLEKKLLSWKRLEVGDFFHIICSISLTLQQLKRSWSKSIRAQEGKRKRSDEGPGRLRVSTTSGARRAGHWQAAEQTPKRK